MGIHKPDPQAHQMVLLDKAQKLLFLNDGRRRQSPKKGEDFFSGFQVAAGQLTDNENVNHSLSTVEQCPQMRIPVSEVENPNRGIDKDHGSRRSTPGNLVQGFFCSAQPGQALGAFLGDQGLKPHSDDRRFLSNPRQTGRLLQDLVIDVEGRSHAYQYA